MRVAVPRKSLPAWLVSTIILAGGLLLLLAGVLLVRRTTEQASKSSQPVVSETAPAPVKKPAHSGPGSSKRETAKPGQVAAPIEFAVEANVEGATVRVDGETKPEWVTPCRITLPLGLYRIEVGKPGYQARTRVVQFTLEGPRRLKFELPQQP